MSREPSIAPCVGNLLFWLPQQSHPSLVSETTLSRKLLQHPWTESRRKGCSPSPPSPPTCGWARGSSDHGLSGSVSTGMTSLCKMRGVEISRMEPLLRETKPRDFIGVRGCPVRVHRQGLDWIDGMQQHRGDRGTLRPTWIPRAGTSHGRFPSVRAYLLDTLITMAC